MSATGAVGIPTAPASHVSDANSTVFHSVPTTLYGRETLGQPETFTEAVPRLA
jgi:hypothetical protein